MLLIYRERREDAYEYPARREHDDDPEVELLVGPVIRLPHHYPLPGHDR